ncbi:MAG: DUF4234 domain-containing protein [Sandaracinaceae bacterium]|nr:DUF4234 domain-containing protein [Sandaracinaceae bacterium]
MEKRNPLAVVALTFVTFTLYAYYWLYKTTDELKKETGRDELQPLVDVLLAAMTFGIWGVWAAIRNARLVHEEMQARGASHTDRAFGVAAFAGLTMFTGWAWLVSMAILQDDYNRLAETEFLPESDALFASAAARPAVRARVAVEPPATPVEHPTERPVARPTRRAEASNVPVFLSNAPAPIVY